MKVVPSKSTTEIERLAMAFHQDFALMEMTPEEVFAELVQRLDSKRQNELKNEIAQLLSENPGSEQRALRKRWRKLGAGWWDAKNHDLRQYLENCANEISRQG